ncbi:hypothetical protein SADUNF_Sadunf05G0121200 [Salix dunnii]|uniref:Uncharacterized protein n=1 Tax=Salix dunnii TaxID=1413687 RepID=A0A835KAY3_9ROSI|nr:hypothetical protein SADUNF_Sadunf05G0121200 [Salix dunnii]
MARFRYSVNEKRGVGASRTQQQEQEQQRGDSEADSNTGLRPPLLPPALALPAFQGSNGSGNGLARYETSEDNREELQEVIYSLLNLRLHLIVLHAKTICIRGSGRRYDKKEEEERSCQIRVVLSTASAGKLVRI